MRTRLPFLALRHNVFSADQKSSSLKCWFCCYSLDCHSIVTFPSNHCVSNGDRSFTPIFNRMKKYAPMVIILCVVLSYTFYCKFLDNLIIIIIRKAVHWYWLTLFIVAYSVSYIRHYLHILFSVPFFCPVHINFCFPHILLEVFFL